MNGFLVLCFLFFIGSTFGWVLELLFRRFFSKNNPERRWINPGFLIGPYLPLYGFGLCLLYGLAQLPVPGAPWLAEGLRFVLIAAAMTLIELLTGLLAERVGHVKLWDYSAEWGNFKGLICPKFSLAWAVLGAAYVWLLHPRMQAAVLWLSENLAFSFFIGLFFGVLLVDLGYSVNILARIRQFSAEYRITVRYEELKAQIHRAGESLRSHRFWRFVSPMSGSELKEHIRRYAEGKLAALPRRRSGKKDEEKEQSSC